VLVTAGWAWSAPLQTWSNCDDYEKYW